MTRTLPKLDRLRALFEYRPETGELVRRVSAGRSSAGSVCSRVSDGYVVVGVDGEQYRAARLAWYLMTEVDPGEREVDHVNRRRSDDRWSNLRLATDSDQMRNADPSTQNSLGPDCRNIRRRPSGRYGVRIRGRSGEKRTVGTFSSLDEARVARDEALLAEGLPLFVIA